MDKVIQVKGVGILQFALKLPLGRCSMEERSNGFVPLSKQEMPIERWKETMER